MIRFMIPLLMTLATPALAAGPTGEAKLAGLLRGRVAGTPTACITLLRDHRSMTIERIGLVYDVGSTRYVTRFDGGCDALTSFTNVETRTPSSQLCEGDIAQIVTQPSPVVPVGSCTFGKFTPYTRAH